jgi:hypothetical protein
MYMSHFAQEPDFIYAKCVFSVYASEDYKLNTNLSPNVDWSDTLKVCLKYNHNCVSLLHTNNYCPKSQSSVSVSEHNTSKNET